MVADPSRVRSAEVHDADVLVLYRLSDSRLARNVLTEIEGRLRPRGIKHAAGRICLRGAGNFAFWNGSGGFGWAHPAAFRKPVDAGSSPPCTPNWQPLSSIDGVSATGIEADGNGHKLARSALPGVSPAVQGGAPPDRISDLRRIRRGRSRWRAANTWPCARCDPESASDAAGGGQAARQNYRSEDMAAVLRAVSDGAGRPPFTALIVWGVVEGYLLERALADLGWKPGIDIGVVAAGKRRFSLRASPCV